MSPQPPMTSGWVINGQTIQFWANYPFKYCQIFCPACWPGSFSRVTETSNNIWILILMHSSEQLTQLPLHQCWLETYCTIREGCQMHETHTSTPSCQKYLWKQLIMGKQTPLHYQKHQLRLLPLACTKLWRQFIQLMITDTNFQLTLDLIIQLSPGIMLKTDNQLRWFSLLCL